MTHRRPDDEAWCCGQCGFEGKSVPIVYGYPSSEASDAAVAGEIVLGGCVVTGDDPEIACSNCGAALDDYPQRPLVTPAQGLDPLTLRTLALDSGAGANLLQVAPLPETHSFTSFNSYDRCPLQYAFGYVYRMPRPDEPVAAFTFGTTAHDAFEAFTKDRRERMARGDPLPTREDLEREFRSRWVPTEFGDKTTEEGYQRRVASLLDNFWQGEVSSLSEALHEEMGFELALEPEDGSPPVVVTGKIDRIDRLPSGGIEVIDYKTGQASNQKAVDESLQLSIYSLACRDALNLGTPERVTLYFTESALRVSTTRTDEQLDLARANVLARLARMRSGDFAATPSPRICQWCDYARMCPESLKGAGW